MKKVFSILVITVWLMQAVTINVHAAPMRGPALQAPDPVVDLEGETPVVVDITNELTPSQIVSEEYVVTGDGTPLLVVTGTAISYCYLYFGAYFCTGANFDVTVKNNNGATMTLNACTTVNISNAVSGETEVNSIGTARYFWEPDDWDSLGNPTAIPFADCVQYELEDEQIYTVGVRSGKSLQPEGQSPDEFTWTFTMYLSYAPINTCTDDAPPISTAETFDLDPTVEFPDGVTDDQVYTTTPGSAYRITTDGYWQDRVGKDHHNIAVMVSWDGELWVPALCVSNDIDDETALYFIAESTTLYIRVSSQPGTINWEDNTIPTPPYTYTVEAVLFMSASCESQYTFDEYEDVVGFVGVAGTNEQGVLANNADIPLVVGDWYVVSWNYGYWQDAGGSNKTALEYSWYGSGAGYSNLGGGLGGGDGSPSGSVWCVSEDGLSVLIQASAENLYLRVDDVPGDFADNTGTPYYDIYHATFTRTPASCEATMQIGDFIEHKTVQADQGNGEPFAAMFGGSITHVGLTPGAWYMLETSDGPWWAAAINPFKRYDMAVSEDGSTWEPFEDWDVPTCNVEIDTLGHRRIIFQMPSAGEIEYSLRVDASGGWFINLGSMSWDLYGATQMSTTPGPDGCDYSYDEMALLSSGTWSSTSMDGISLAGLDPNELYAIVIIPVGDGWKESIASGDFLNAVQISHNNGHQFYALPEEYTPALCYETDISGDVQTVFVKPGENYQYKLRVDSDTFTNNWGDMSYQVYGAAAGQSLINTCFNGYSLQSLNEFDWLDVRAETGEILSSDTARYEEFLGLIPGRMYAVETPAGQGPWRTGGADHWDVAITNDNGVTWEAITMDNTMIDCASQELIGHVWKAKFTMEEGQVWKLRVNDDAGAFADNTGNMAYKFYVLCEGMACTGSVPNDSTGPDQIGAVTIQGGGDVCEIAVMRPSPLSVSELLNVGNYFGAWVQYINLSVLRYMAWCPVHTNLFLTFINKFKTVEPLATVLEWEDNLQTVKRELASYDWGEGSGDAFSLWDVENTGEIESIISERVFPSDNDGVWSGGLISFGEGSGLPDAYYSCGSALTTRLPDSLKTGVCFVSAYFIETSASFWIQIVLDIGAFFLIFAMLKGALQDTIYMMTGVKPWTKSGANASIDKLAAYMERRDREDEVNQELGRRFDGSFRSGSDGSYRR